MKNKDKYLTLCKTEPSIPIFSQAWWLDAVCGDSWDVCLVEKGGKIVGSMPYHFSKRLGLTFLSHPKLTQTLGPWLRQSNTKYAKRLGQEKEILNELIRQLPNFAHFHQKWHHLSTNWLPFYWHGFQQTTLYTYRLPNLFDIDEVWTGFRENIRRDVRKANNRFNLTIRSDSSIDDFLTIHVQTFERQGIRPPYSETFIRQLDAACIAHKARKIFIAEDEQGRYHAGVYVIWDKESTYYIMGGGNPELRASGATSLCMWEAIQFAATITKSFDFEGSMIEPIERFFRGFGAIQTPYHSISYTPSKPVRIYRGIRSLFNS